MCRSKRNNTRLYPSLYTTKGCIETRLLQRLRKNTNKSHVDLIVGGNNTPNSTTISISKTTTSWEQVIGRTSQEQCTYSKTAAHAHSALIPKPSSFLRNHFITLSCNLPSAFFLTETYRCLYYEGDNLLILTNSLLQTRSHKNLILYRFCNALVTLLKSTGADQVADPSLLSFGVYDPTCALNQFLPATIFFSVIICDASLSNGSFTIY
jgi:hypothetical protein